MFILVVLTVMLLLKSTSCYDGPVAAVYHGYPGSQSFVNIKFNEPDHKLVKQFMLNY